MGKRRIIVKKSAAESIAQVAWFIESKGLVATAEKYVDLTYDFIDKLAEQRNLSLIVVIRQENNSDISVLHLKGNFQLSSLNQILKLLFVSSFLPN